MAGHARRVRFRKSAMEARGPGLCEECVWARRHRGPSASGIVPCEGALRERVRVLCVGGPSCEGAGGLFNRAACLQTSSQKPKALQR